MEYKFYIRTFDTRHQYDVETDFHCKYRRLTNVFEEGEIKNVYMEDYAEMDGTRVYIPDTPHYKTTELQLTLRFKGDTVVEDSKEFLDVVQGRKIQWFDTFRNVYLCLLLTKTPTIGSERLYGGKKWRDITYTFTNLKGTYSTTPYIQ